MNQLSHGQRINIPTSVVRSVSFQKVRQGSLSSRTVAKIQTQPKQEKTVQSSEHLGLCQRLMSKKLLTNDIKNQPKLFQNRIVNVNENNKVTFLKKQLEQKQMKQCTFKPKVNKSNQPNRTVEQFVDQQLAYKRYKQDKINQMRQMIKAKADKQNTFQPNLMLLAKNQQSKRSVGQVHQRLYEQWTKKQQSKQNQIPQSNEKRPSSKFSSKSKIATFSRKGSQKSIIESSLQSKKHTLAHNDLSQFSETSKQMTQGCQLQTNRKQSARGNSCQSAKSQKGLKITKYMDVQEVCDKKVSNKTKLHDQRQKQKQQKKVNPKNKQLFVKKILREISCIIGELGIMEINLSYMQMSLILQKMNFLDDQTNINDRRYSYEIWQMLQGDLYQSCPLGNLIKIIFCLLGCHDFSIIQECLAMFMPESTFSKKLVLTDKQSRNIKANFEQLSLNRLRKGQYITNEPKYQQYSFKPFVSKNSSQMAQKYRQRVIQESSELLNKNLIQFQIADNKQVDHIDLLMLDDKRKQLKMRIKRQQQQRQKKRLEDQSMQGEKIKRRGRTDLKINSNQQQGGNSRIQHLYELGKYNIRTKKQIPTQQQKISKQCTFHPNIIRSKQNSNRAHSKQSSQHHRSIEASHHRDQIKDFDKSIFRMYEGRRIREQSYHNSKIMSDRSVSEHHHVSRQDDTPFLYLNICMEGCDDFKVPVFHNDNMKTITHKVKLLIGLQNAQDSRLQQILKLQILPTLQEIGMNIDFQ